MLGHTKNAIGIGKGAIVAHFIANGYANSLSFDEQGFQLNMLLI